MGKGELSVETHDLSGPQPGAKKGVRFWLIFVSICVSVFLSAFEFTATSNALPTIVQDLQGDDFVWVGSAYPLAATALLPMSGGVAEIFGRRFAMLFSLALFTLGSALCGSAKSMSWLIAGRTVQGAGGGAIQSISSIVVSDMVTLKERGLYNAMIGGTWAIASVMAPLVSGALAEEGQWRWLFYLNIPIAGAAAILVVLFMKMKTPEGTLKQKLAKMDWIGNFLCIGSTTAITLGLTWGGVTFAWNSARVISLLVIGFCGLCAFLAYEAWFATYPLVPWTLISNRTSLSGYAQTFLTPFVTISVIYYLAVYFQACKGASPIATGVDALGMTAITGPAVVFCGASVAIYKVYRPQLWTGWIVLISGMAGLCSLKSDSPVGVPIGLALLVQAGASCMQAAAYFPVLAPLPISENAHALAFFAFCRTFAGVWGVTIGGAILQNELGRHLPREFLASLPAGVAFAFSAVPAIKNLPEPVRTQVREGFAKSIDVIWYVMTAVAVVGLFSSLFMKALPLHTQMDEKWGLEEERRKLAAAEERGEGVQQSTMVESDGGKMTDVEMRAKTSDESLQHRRSALPSV